MSSLSWRSGMGRRLRFDWEGKKGSREDEEELRSGVKEIPDRCSISSASSRAVSFPIGRMTPKVLGAFGYRSRRP